MSLRPGSGSGCVPQNPGHSCVSKTRPQSWGDVQAGGVLTSIRLSSALGMGTSPFGAATGGRIFSPLFAALDCQPWGSRALVCP